MFHRIAFVQKTANSVTIFRRAPGGLKKVGVVSLVDVHKDIWLIDFGTYKQEVRTQPNALSWSGELAFKYFNFKSGAVEVPSDL